MMFCLATLLLAGALNCQTGLERPYAFLDTPYRPLSSAFELDTRAYIRAEQVSLSLDLWRNPSVGSPRTSTGIDLWSLMIGWSF